MAMFLIKAREFRSDSFYPYETEIGYCTSKEVAEQYCQERNRFREYAPDSESMLEVLSFGRCLEMKEC